MLCREPPGAWRLEGSCVPLPAAAVEKSISYAKSREEKPGQFVSIPFAAEEFLDWCKVLGANERALARLDATVVVRALKAADELGDDKTVEKVCLILSNCVRRDLELKPFPLVTSGSSPARIPGTFKWATQALLEMPEHLAHKTFTIAASEMLFTHTDLFDAINEVLPRVSRLPPQLHATAIKAFTPTIESKHTWSINLSAKHLRLCEGPICASLSAFASLTSISFRLSPQPGTTAAPAPLDSPTSHSLGRIAAAIWELPCLSSLTVDLRAAGGACLQTFLSAWYPESFGQRSTLTSLQLLCRELHDLDVMSMQCRLAQMPRLKHFGLTVDSPTTPPMTLTMVALGFCLGSLTALESLSISHPASCAASAACLLSGCAWLQLRSLTLHVQFTGYATDNGAAVGDSEVATNRYSLETCMPDILRTYLADMDGDAAVTGREASTQHATPLLLGDAASGTGMAGVSGFDTVAFSDIPGIPSALPSPPGRPPDEGLAAAVGCITSLQDLTIVTNAPVPGFGGHLLRHCTQLTSLRRLRIAGPLQASCSADVRAFLQVFNLEELQVSGTPRRAAGAAGAAAAPRLCTLPVTAYAVQLMYMTSLTSLDLSDTRVEAVCAGDMLAAVLPRMAALWRLKWVRLTEEPRDGDWREALRLLAGSIARVPCLGELHVSGGVLAARLTPCFNKMRGLCKVALYGRIPWAMPMTIGSCYADLATLRDVRLIGNGSPQGVLGSLAKVVAGMADLDVLILSYQKVEYEFAACLAAALFPEADENSSKRPREGGRGPTRLETLGLGGCGMDADAVGALSPALHFLAGECLTRLMLWGNDASAASRVAASLRPKFPCLLIDSDS